MTAMADVGFHPMRLINSTDKQPESKVPRFVYGTAWKKDRSAELVTKALRAGFTGIDTAAQPKHYQENLVGDGIKRAIQEGYVKRKDLYVQTKFTPPPGQDPNNLPYDPKSSLEAQIRTSISSSLRNLGVPVNTTQENSYLDTLILHSPLATLPDTLEAWKIFESYVPNHIHHLGISNTNLRTLRTLFEEATIKPSIVQNRFYPGTRHDSNVRRFCKDKNIVYQSFWTLTGNPELLGSEVVKKVTEELKLRKPVGLYLCVMGLGNVSVLNGTTSSERMKEDLEGLNEWQKWIGEEGNLSKWEDTMHQFRALLGEQFTDPEDTSN